MLKKKLHAAYFILSFVFFVAVFCSCNTYKTVPYFTDLPQTGQESINTVPYQEPIIQTDDLLSISVQTIDPANNAIFQENAGDLSSSIGATATSPFSKANGYLVDKEGNIILPFTGNVHVAGLNRLQARDTITARLSRYFKVPTVDVRFINFKITVIGEVLHPSTYTVTNEKVTIFDALGLAGDLTVYGKRENVVLIRDSLNAKKLIRLNLNSKDIIKSPYFYLRQNDIIYVEPSEAKAASLDAARTRTLAITGTVLSVIIVIFSRLVR